MNKEKLLSKEINNKLIKSIVLYILAFFIPVIIFIGIFIYLKIYPFGENTYLPSDASGQYISYLQYFKNLFFGDSSVIYSMSKSIGGEMYGLFAYYLMSPFNFITLFFHNGNLTFAYDVITVCKIATCSLSMVYYLNRKKEADFKNIIFGLMYSFSAYVVTYGFNIMWLDGVILLPFVIAGIDDLIQYKKVNLYIISLTLTLITNYYIGFIVCVFSVIYFIYKLIVLSEKNDIKRLILKYILSSITATLIASFILVPVFIGLQNGRADFSFSNLNFEKNFRLENILAKLFTNSFELDEIKNDSMPPIFSGILANVLVTLYFLNKNIRIKERIATLTVFSIFVTSFYFFGINTLWTMGNIPAWFKYRYAFTFIFFFIVIANKRNK